MGETVTTPAHRDSALAGRPEGPGGSTPLTTRFLLLLGPPSSLPRPAAPPTHDPAPCPHGLCGGGESSGPERGGLRRPRGPRGRLQPAAGRRRRGRSGAGRWPRSTARPSARPAPPGFRGTRRKRTGINTFDFVAKVNGNCHPGATWALGSRALPVPGPAGRERAADWLESLDIPRAAPPPDWLRCSDDQLGPIEAARGAAPLFSGANSRGGRADLAPRPGAAPLGVNALAVGRCTWVRDPRGGGAAGRPGCALWPNGRGSRSSPPPGLRPRPRRRAI